MPENTHPAASDLDVNTSPWWSDAVIYQIYPRSFADANNDGMGDLAGVTSRLPYLARLGIDAVWLSPFYLSPQADAGYDVADYRRVDPRFGALSDFDEMLAAAHERKIRVIIDLVPNHTSDENVWFRAAVDAASGSAERERYIFRDGKGPHGDEPPNNWHSVFGGGAWTRVIERHGPAAGRPGQWYLHLFDTKQPDLNWQNAQVRAEMESVLRFWLDRGVDGFRIDVAHGLVKAAGLPDWEGRVGMVEGDSPRVRDAGADTIGPGAGPAGAAPAGAPPAVGPEADTAVGPGADSAAAPGTDSADTGTTAVPADADPTGSAAPQPPSPEPSPMFDQDGVHEIYRDWHRLLAGYPGDRMLVAEAWVEPPERLARYVREGEMQQAFNFNFLLAGWDAHRIVKSIDESLTAAASVGATTTWVLSNHDTVRHSSRFGLADPVTATKGIGPRDEQPDEPLGLARARAATLIMLALPGSAYIYQGEELGLPEHTTLPDDVRQDPTFLRTDGEQSGRDGSRVPLPWRADAPGCGFSSTDGRRSDVAAAPWLPQPDSFARHAADREVGVGGSTYELYRSAIRIRAERRLGRGMLDWSSRKQAGGNTVSFSNGELLVLANMEDTGRALPPGYSVLLASDDDAVTGDRLAPNAAVWLLPARGSAPR